MKLFAKICISIFSIFLLICVGLSLYVILTIKSAGETASLNIAKLNSFNSQVKIFDNNDKEIVTTSAKGNQTISLEELPKYVGESFISIEDKKFYTHNGLNFSRIVKAFLNNLKNGYAKEGASTITQQLIKNTHLSNEKTLSRKIQEAYLSTKLEKKYTKKEILETYLNVIYFGNNSYGIESASQNFFGHSAKNLTLAESAVLAGLIKSPKKYSPIFNIKNCKERRNLVLKNMYEDKKISQKDFEVAKNSEIVIKNNHTQKSILNNILIEKAMEILNLSETDVSTKGFKIYTYIDSNLQNDLLKIQNDIENALIVIDNENNSVISYIGDAKQKRQLGSTIKPVLCYAPAFEYGKLSPITPINDEETNFNGYIPKNANNKFLGWTSARDALAKSLNIPAIKTLEYTGIDKSIDLAQKFGLSFDKSDNHLAIALGATKYGENLQTITNAYASFARNGIYSDLKFIKKIETNNGQIIYKNKNHFNRIIGEDTAYLINNVLQDTTKIGTAKRLSTLNLNIAAKTGTVGTKNKKNSDAWCISYTPQYTVGTWFGNTKAEEFDLSPSQNGGTIATDLNKIIWQKISKKRNINQNFSCPKSVKKFKIDALSLSSQKVELADKNTPEMYIVEDLFSIRFAPKKLSANFKIITTPVLKLTKTNNNLIFNFEGVDYLNYTLIQIDKSNIKEIKFLEGKNEKQTITIPLPKENTSYYLKVTYKNKNIKGEKNSNIVKYFVTDVEYNKKSTNIWRNWFL